MLASLPWIVSRCWFVALVVFVRLCLGGQTRAIRRIPYGKLTFLEFFKFFRQGDRPFILTDVPNEQSPCFGELSVPPRSVRNVSEDPLMRALRRHCQRGSVPIQRMVRDEIRKGLSTELWVHMREFLQLWGHPGKLHAKLGLDVAQAGGLSVITQGIQDHCSPELWKHIRFPAYFSGEVRLRAKEWGLAYDEYDGYPSIYFSQKGLSMTMHVDNFATEIWSAICRGKKKYRITPFSVARRHLPTFASFEERWATLNNASALADIPTWEGIVGPGEVLYFPASALHAVEALEDTFNIVNNFIDAGWLGSLSPGAMEGLILEKKDSLLEWFKAPRLEVFDEVGTVTTANVTPRGFPEFGDLLERIRGSRRGYAVGLALLRDNMRWDFMS